MRIARRATQHWGWLLALGLWALAPRAAGGEIRFSAADADHPGFSIGDGAARVVVDGRPAVRLAGGAALATRDAITPPPSGFSMLLRLRVNEAGDPTVGDQVHNHAILRGPSMVLIVTWGDVLVWHLPFPAQGKIAEIHSRLKPGRDVVLGWVVGPEAMVAYVDGQPVGRVALPAPLAAKEFPAAPLSIGGSYGADRALSLDVYEFIYADVPWDDEEMAARSAGTGARLVPKDLASAPVAGPPTLSAGAVRLWINPGTGEMWGYCSAGVPGAPVARSLDIYRLLDGRVSSESEDRVLALERTRPGHVTVECANDTLGLRITKEYALDPATGELRKTITLRAGRPVVVAVEGRSAVSDAFRDGAFYTQWLHHTHNQRLFIPSAEVTATVAAAPDSRMQSRLVLLTRPDLQWTYGEVPLSVDGEPLYPSIPDEAFDRKTLLTANGWQALRAVVEVRPGRAHRVVTCFRWAPTSHLGFLREYVAAHYGPAFAPQPGSRLARRDLACDGTGVFLCNLARPEGDRLVYNGPGGTWALARLSGIIARISPKAYGTCVIFEGFSHGDILTDNVYQWIPEDRGGPKGGRTNVFRTSLGEYMRIVHLAEADAPRFRWGRYERVGVMEYATETVRLRPDILAPPDEGAPLNPAVYPMPYFWDDRPAAMLDTDPLVYFDLLGRYFVRLIRLGLPIAYLDFSVPSDYVRRSKDEPRLVSWADQIAMVRKMAGEVHAAGGTYFVNLPSGPWADLGYMEYTPWAADNAKDWRVLADRLQLTKAQEIFPNTTIPLYFQGPDYPRRCLAYSLVPNPFFAGWFDGSGTGDVVAEELVRLRWALRDAEMTGAMVRPLPWEPGAEPVEACVMRLGQELYIPLILHAESARPVHLWADLAGLLPPGRKAAVWRCDFASAPWDGPPEKPFSRDRVELSFTRLEKALDARGRLTVSGILEPEKLTLILVGDWSKHPPFAPVASR